MGQIVVVTDQLTDAMIESGAELTRELLEGGTPLDAALWWFDPDVNEWRLLFASSDVDVLDVGRQGIYGRLQDIFGRLGVNAAAVPFSALRLRSPHDELIRYLKKRFHTGPTIQRIRYRGVINGFYIHDALIYRVAGSGSNPPDQSP